MFQVGLSGYWTYLGPICHPDLGLKSESIELKGLSQAEGSVSIADRSPR